jgi:EAL domain-containing protein (putative c-di-GMP-specific phosphodiesterase class I)
MPNISLAVNISHLTIGNREWLKTFFAEVTPDLANRLIIEITETAANRSLRDTAYFIATLQEAGCQVALDDFGSGHTSYRQVRSLSIDMIKIDGSLIADIETNSHNQILVSALVKYFKEYGLKIVAEHVDSGACAKLLMDYGVDYMQGHYFGKASEVI